MVPNEMKTKKACSTKIYPITDRESVLESLSKYLNFFVFLHLQGLGVGAPLAQKTQNQLQEINLLPPSLQLSSMRSKQNA